MDTVTLVAGGIAVFFALLAMLQWRRAADLEARVAELEAKLLEREPPPREILDREEASEAPVAEAEPEAEPEPEPETETESETETEPEPETETEPETEAAPEPEPETEAETETEPEPEAETEAETEPEAAPSPAPPPSRPEPDPLRLEALKIVSEAFETCRYLDFDAIVRKPSTYRVTVPITAANADAVRYLEDGMFGCLEKVIHEDTRAVLHIDMSKGKP